MFLLKLLLLIATSTVATEALKCYKCGDSTPCPEPFDSTNVAKPTCPGVNQDVCTGYKYEDGRVTRGCDTFDILKEDVHPDVKKDQCVKIRDDYKNEDVEICLCTADECNDGNIFSNENGSDGSDNVLVITLVSVFGSIAVVCIGVFVWWKAKDRRSI